MDYQNPQVKKNFKLFSQFSNFPLFDIHVNNINNGGSTLAKLQSNWKSFSVSTHRIFFSLFLNIRIQHSAYPLRYVMNH